jgi:glycerate 2-kinase
MVSGTALRADALACHAAALAAIEAGGLVERYLVRQSDLLVLRDRAGRVLGEHGGPVLLVGAGKAGLAMARAAATIVGGRCRGGIVVVPHRREGDCPGGVDVFAGGHPLPDAAGEAATGRLLAAVRAAGPDTLVLVVLSGGGSALLVAPAEGVTLADKIALTRALLASGADIGALNAVRKHCSRVKGGGLARLAGRAAAIWTLALSDVAGDDPAIIASGPTVADPSTFEEAEAALLRYLAPGEIPAGVRERIARGSEGQVPETVKPGDPVLARSRYVVVGANVDAVSAAAEVARSRGYATDVLGAALAGDAAEAGRLIAARLRAAPSATPVAIVGGGETTVRAIPGGRGGRAQHLALAAAIALAGEPAVLLAAGTDGVDGPTDAAGACVDGGTVGRARARGLDPGAALVATDSHPLLDATGDLLRTGPTGTNVADLVVALRATC